MTETNPEEVTNHLLERAQWSASRSSGPGGQRRDKVSTRAELVIDGDALDGLPEDVADRIQRHLGLDRGPLRITAQEERALSQNRALCAERLEAMVAEALAPPPPKRRATRPGPAARARRVAVKRQRSEVKRLRKPPGDSA
ncbi:MAG: alternative ribosome rescue aminoacyl-tRNA hydrolase ArfB [Candidatus Dormiibacterota bacterium]